LFFKFIAQHSALRGQLQQTASAATDSGKFNGKCKCYAIV